ncbi:hypothetical protein ABFS83_08G154000 [Erythranthe nasuta]
MAAEKVTPMVLKVDLQCPCCYKKIKKTLCKFPQIRDQVYDEKANTVTIIVVCCSPEKIRDKLCCKGGKVIKSIEIKEPPKAKEPEKKPKEPENKPKEPEKPKIVVIEKPKEPEKPKVVTFEKPKEPEKPKEKPKSDGPPKEAPKGGEPAKKPEAAAAKPAPSAEPAKGPEPVPVNGVPSVFPYVGPSYDGYSSGPYYHGYGFPPPPQPCYEGYYGNGNGYGYGYGPGYGRVGQVNRSDNYFSEENPQACSIM